MLDIAPHLNLTATIASRTLGDLDVHGDPTVTTTTATVDCWVHPDVSTEGASISDNIIGYFAPTVTIDAEDTVAVLGATWQVNGVPEQWIHPDGVTRFQRVRLARTL